MNTWRQIGMMENIPRLQAKRDRRQLRFSPQARMSGKDWYDLILAETENIQQAERAEKQYIAAMLRAGLTPE